MKEKNSLPAKLMKLLRKHNLENNHDLVSNLLIMFLDENDKTVNRLLKK